MKYIVYNINGEYKCDVKTLDYSGKWMGENYVSVDVANPTPVQFELGDYVDYRGVRYTLYSSPTVEKNHAPMNGYNSFVYEGVRFMGPNDELMRCSFLDYVFDTGDATGSNVNYFAQTPTFSFNCGTIFDLTDRIQVNLNRLYSNWEIRVNESAEYAHNIDISVDNNTVWEALMFVSTRFKSSFIVQQEVVDGVRKNVILIGYTLTVHNDVLSYGKDNGLLKIQRGREDSGTIINRLRVYGSTKNLPFKYYSEVYDPWYKFPYTTNGVPSMLNWHENKEIGTGVYPITEKLDFIVTSPIKRHSVSVVFSDDITKRYNGYIGTREDVEEDGIKLDGRVVGSSWQYYLVVRFYPFMDVTQESKDESTRRFSDVDKILIVSGITRLMASTMVEQYWVSPYQLAPEYVSIENLMLPSFLDYYAERNGVVTTLDKTKVSRIYNDEGNVVLLKYWDGEKQVDYIPVYVYDDKGKKVTDDEGHWKLKLQSDPYIEDAESIKKYGIREGCVFFDSEEEDSETPAIYPTIQADKKNKIYIGTEDKIEDNGFLEDEDKLKGGILEFYLYVPYLGFDPKNYWSEKHPTLKMTSGACMGRTFELVGDNYYPFKENAYDGTLCTKFRLRRVFDEHIGCYFPNKDTEIVAGDEFVLLDIDLPRYYVEDASNRLLAAAMEYLADKSYPKFTATPTLDNIKLARDYDKNGEDSLYYKLKEGYLLNLNDSDLGLDVSAHSTKLFIDNLTIKEAEGKVPVVGIKLAREKEFSSIQKLQAEIHRLHGYNNSLNLNVNWQRPNTPTEDSVQVGGENILENSGFVGNRDYLDIKNNVTIDGDLSVFGDRLSKWEKSDLKDVISVETIKASSGFACQLNHVGSWIRQAVKLSAENTYTLSFKCSGRLNVLNRCCGDDSEEKLCVFNLAGADTEYVDFVALTEGAQIWDVKLERGNVKTDWKPSQNDTDPIADALRAFGYLQDALKGKTEILGGLILSSMLQLGNYRNGEMEQVTAGVSGVTNGSTSDVAFWGGGTFEQAIKAVSMFKNNPSYQPTEEEVASIAKAVITHGGRAILNDIVLRGYIYALGGVFNGTVNATDGVFKGRVEAKEGYFLGSTRSVMTEITPENISKYVVSGSGELGAPYNFDFDEIGTCIRFSGDIGYVYMKLPYMDADSPLTQEERDEIRTRDLSRVLVYNNTIGDSFVGVNKGYSSTPVPQNGWVEFSGKLTYDYIGSRGEYVEWSVKTFDPKSDGPMEASLD